VVLVEAETEITAVWVDQVLQMATMAATVLERHLLIMALEAAVDRGQLELMEQILLAVRVEQELAQA
tara:strand:+ start:487 stop:687 length:201 start_codon:yes stop_codon:yes gene_type:complete